MKTLEQIIPDAMIAIDSHIAAGDNVSKEFNGYISSLGASIISSGLLPTLLFFGEKGGARADRPKLIVAIEKMLVINNIIGQNVKLVVEVKNCIIQRDNLKLERLTDEVMKCATALKLVIRTYNLN